MKELIENVETTPRGFQVIRFADAHQMECSLQQSSAIDDTERGMSQPGSSFVWLGLGDERMHLHRDHVCDLVEQLRHWLVNGRFITDPTATPDPAPPDEER